MRWLSGIKKLYPVFSIPFLLFSVTLLCAQGEFLIDTQPGSYSQSNPAVAYDGTNYLVVWQDTRNGTYDIYGARVGAGGTILDTIPIAISTASNDQIKPQVTFGDLYYLVVWEDYRNDVYNFDVYGCRVNKIGNILDTSGIVIKDLQASYALDPAVSFDGTNYFITYSSYDIYFWDEIYGEFLSPSGQSVGWGVNIGGSTVGDDHRSRIAFDGTNYLVVWHALDKDILGSRVTPSGSNLDVTPIPICTATGNQTEPEVAFDGANYLVVWQDDRNGNMDIYGARVTPSGSVLDPEGFPICTQGSTQTNPAIAFDGTNYVVVWEDYRNGNADLYGAVLSPTGSVLDTFIVSSKPGDQVTPSLAHGSGNQILIVYSGWTDTYNGIPINTMRIWARFYPITDVDENTPRKSYVSTLRIYPLFLAEDDLFTIQWTSKNPSVSIEIYNIKGDQIARWEFSNKNEGVIIWNLKNKLGVRIKPGIYFVTLSSDKEKYYKKFIVLR